MANPFLADGHDEIETAIMLENAYVTDIGKAVAYTDGKRLFINTEDNLFKILPAYDLKMLKWLLWHERYHMELKHHNRFFKYLKELSAEDTEEKFQVTKEEVNIIMDILVHDSLSKMFPELVDTAIANLAQMRNRNSLGYTFTTRTLEEMLDEYREYKKSKEEDKSEGEGGDSDEETKDSEEKSESDTPKTSRRKTHGEGGKSKKPPKEKPKGTDEKDTPSSTDEEKDKEDPVAKPEHDKTDWSKLDDIDQQEFIDSETADAYVAEIERLKRMKINLGKITQTLNGLATTAKMRTYATPSTIRAGKGIILKGRKPGKTELYLVFDASGSMSSELKLFKEIISRSIPQAMDCPCEWFAGCCQKIEAYKTVGDQGYFKGTFKDIMPVYADDGFSDDGNRTIDLCLAAEQKGFSPIGVTDGGGNYYRPTDGSRMVEKVKQLRRTILVSQSKSWLDSVLSVNPHIKTINIERR